MAQDALGTTSPSALNDAPINNDNNNDNDGEATSTETTAAYAVDHDKATSTTAAVARVVGDDISDEASRTTTSPPSFIDINQVVYYYFDGSN